VGAKYDRVRKLNIGEKDWTIRERITHRAEEYWTEDLGIFLGVTAVYFQLEDGRIYGLEKGRILERTMGGHWRRERKNFG
jgi:hypothetical protein